MKISIVIPARNEEKHIGACLRSVTANQSGHYDLEVFVCDGMSTDQTREIVKEFATSHPFIHLLDNTGQTTPLGLNMGIENSNGEYIMILGAHSELPPGYFSRALQVFREQPGAHCVGGLLINEYENSRSAMIGKAMSSGFGVGNAYFRTGTKSGWVDTVAFGIYRREVFEKIGLFDTDLARNQDDEFNYRMQKHHMKIFLDTELNAKYYVRSGFGKLFRQYYQYGFWKVFVNRKHKTITTIRQLVPFLFISFLIVSLAAGILWPPSLMITLPVVLAYILLAISFAFGLTRKPPGIMQTTLAFFVLHSSYGLGYLWGIIWFLLLRQNPRPVHQVITR
jgi:glycosyltransferase involved in cell wall biosynthesis